MMTAGTAWSALIVAGLLDVAWAISIKYADGFSRPCWAALSLVLLAAFVWLLGRAMQVLPLGTAYIVWSGIGAAGAVLMGVVLFREPLTATRLLGFGLVIAGVWALRAQPQ